MNGLFWHLFICLVCGHIIGDFLLQTNWLVQKKKKHRGWLRVHCLVVGLVTYLICGAWTMWVIPVMVILQHFIIDGIKLRIKRDNFYIFLGDQAAHLVLLSALTWVILNLYPHPQARQTEPFISWVDLWGMAYLQLIVLLTGVIVITKVASIVIGYGVRPLLAQLKQQQEEAVRAGRIMPAMAEGFRNGGQLIGILERLLILLLVLVKLQAGIGFLIAAKSIMRFGEIKDREDRMQAEYIIIGTFMSFGCGIALAYGILGLMNGFNHGATSAATSIDTVLDILKQ